MDKSILPFYLFNKIMQTAISWISLQIVCLKADEDSISHDFADNGF